MNTNENYCETYNIYWWILQTIENKKEHKI
jgi:hypothetical protein